MITVMTTVVIKIGPIIVVTTILIFDGDIIVALMTVITNINKYINNK